MFNINISHKDKSVILLISVVLIILWFIIFGFSLIFNNISFKSSEINKINDVEKNLWFNVAKPIKSQDLSGKIVVLHFWSYSCVSCLESIERLKELEEYHQNSIAIIGVHSPIFDNEKQYNAVKKSIIRHHINYPIINDPNLELTKKFAIKKTPTFLVFGLDGKIEKRVEGVKSLDNFIKIAKKLVHKNKFSLNHDKLPIILESNNISNILSAPSKLVYVEKFSYKGRQVPVLIIANSGHNSIIVSQISGELILNIGKEGLGGFVDGGFNEARFLYPQSVAYDGKNIYVADTGNNAIRMINLKDNKVETLIGSSSGGMGGIIEAKKTEAKDIKLSAPNDIEFYPDNANLVISNSGTNQILAFDIKNKIVSILAGNGEEGKNDGVYPNNTLAQTSDMAVYGNKLYLLDARTSSLRVLNRDGVLETLYYSKDEKTIARKLQNPRGLLVDDTGVYISDSFNHAIRKYDFNTRQIINLFGGSRGEDVGGRATFDEPSGLVSIIDKLYVADTNNNRIIAVNRANGNSFLLDIIPPQKLQKESFVEYLPNLQESEDIYVKSQAEIALKINLEKGWKINPIGPSFINLLEFKDENNANLVEAFDWNNVAKTKISFSKLKDDKKYLLQGKIYFCRTSANSLCYIKSYEQKIIAKSDATTTEIEIKIGK